MNILDRLDELEREATLKWEDWNDEEIALQRISRNHLRALIDVARAAESYWRQSLPYQQDLDADEASRRLWDALAPLLAEEEA